MNEMLAAKLQDKLVNEHGFKWSPDRQWLRHGRCPSCGKKSAYTFAAAPWIITCERDNNCGTKTPIKELYPAEFGNFNERFKPTPADPKATAHAYMRDARGIDPKRFGDWYEQGSWWSQDSNRGTATVKFVIDAEQGVYMERFVETVKVSNADGSVSERSQNFIGSHKGRWWQPPGMTINTGDEIWITEAIIDAISLNAAGKKAVAALSTSNYPSSEFDKHRGKKLTYVWAFDNDTAGKRYSRLYTKRCNDNGISAIAALAPGKAKKDWNDALIAGDLCESFFEDCLYYGSLLTARTALEKAMLMWDRNKSGYFAFEFGSRLYWFNLDIEKYTKAIERIEEALEKTGEHKPLSQIQSEAAEQSGGIIQLANVAPEFLYFQQNKITDEAWFYARVNFPDGRNSVNMTFTPNQISSSAEFKKRLVSAQGAWWKGKANHLDWIGERWLSNLKIVETQDYLGYNRELGAYIYPQLAIQNGRAYELNNEDYFKLPRCNIKSLFKSNEPQIHSAKQYVKEWAALVYQAYGAKGLVVAVFFFGSLFAEQIRGELNQASYPFLELIGEPGAGKTTLIELLWRTFGRDNEGIDPNKGTRAGLDRTFGQYSNMPTVLIEGDRSEDSHAKRFDWDELKPYYNGRGMRVRGQKTGGMETYEPPFRGTIVIAQNDPVYASDAVLERIIQVRLTREHHSRATMQASEALNALDVEQLSFYVRDALGRERDILQHLKQRVAQLQDELTQHPKIKLQRLAKNHAQLMALGECFCELMSLDEAVQNDLRQTLYKLCIERHDQIGQDNEMVQQFWETFHYLNTMTERPQLNHSSDAAVIAVNLNHFVEMAAENRQQIPTLKELKRKLRSSKRHKFISASEVIASAIHRRESGAAKSVRCWTFANPNVNTRSTA